MMRLTQKNIFLSMLVMLGCSNHVQATLYKKTPNTGITVVDGAADYNPKERSNPSTQAIKPGQTPVVPQASQAPAAVGSVSPGQGGGRADVPAASAVDANVDGVIVAADADVSQANESGSLSSRYDQARQTYADVAGNTGAADAGTSADWDTSLTTRNETTASTYGQSSETYANTKAESAITYADTGSMSDATTARVEYGSAGDVGTAPPRDYRVDAGGIAVSGIDVVRNESASEVILEPSHQGSMPEQASASSAVADARSAAIEQRLSELVPRKAPKLSLINASSALLQKHPLIQKALNIVMKDVNDSAEAAAKNDLKGVEDAQKEFSRHYTELLNTIMKARQSVLEKLRKNPKDPSLNSEMKAFAALIREITKMKVNYSSIIAYNKNIAKQRFYLLRRLSYLRGTSVCRATA